MEEIHKQLDSHGIQLEQIGGKLKLQDMRMKEIQTELESHKAQLKALWGQEQRNFEMLERDLGGAMDGMVWLKDNKVDKEALRKAAI